MSEKNVRTIFFGQVTGVLFYDVAEKYYAPPKIKKKIIKITLLFFSLFYFKNIKLKKIVLDFTCRSGNVAHLGSSLGKGSRSGSIGGAYDGVPIIWAPSPLLPIAVSRQSRKGRRAKLLAPAEPLPLVEEPFGALRNDFTKIGRKKGGVSTMQLSWCP